MKNILIIGATSAIAQATAKLYCTEESQFHLVSRNEQKLEVVRDDLLMRGAEKVTIEAVDPVKLELHEAIFIRAEASLGSIDLALITHGNLPDQIACESSSSKTVRSMFTNGVSVISLVTIISNHFVLKKSGTLVVLSSVAGDRGRASNYVYGAAKASVSVFMEGLSQRLKDSEVSIITIKPGFVDTPMTKNFAKNFLWVQPEVIAEGIKKAIDKRKNVVYLPWYWKAIMMVVKATPQFIFKRISL